MKASSSSSSYTFGYAALDWCCEGNASLPSDDKHAPLHCASSSSDSLPKSRDPDSKPRSFFRRRSPVDSNASASTASTAQDDLSEPSPLPPTWEPQEVPFPEVSPVALSDRDERALGPIDLDALEEEEQMIPHPSSSHDSTLGSLNTNAASMELPDRACEQPDTVAVTETPAAPTIPESPTEMTESVHVVEDPLLLLLLSQGPERAAPRDPAQLDALLQNILQDDDVTLASSTAHASGDLMDVLAAGPVDVDDFIPEDSYWSMNTQDFVLDEVELSRQLAGYQEGCEPPCIEHVDYEAPSSPPRTRLTRQRTAATAETAELLRRAQGLRRPDVVRRHVTAPTATMRIPQGVVRPTVTHPGVGRPSGASVRSQHASVTTHSVRRPTPRSMPASPQRAPQRVPRTVPPSPSASVATPLVRRPVAQRAVPPSWQPSTQRPHAGSHAPHSVVPPPALRKERRWLPESAAEV